jgi:hypothetical protein
MLNLIWVAEQLESEPPQILEEFQGFEVIVELNDPSQYFSKYQIWAEIEKLLKQAPIKDRLNTVEYVKNKLKNF